MIAASMACSIWVGLLTVGTTVEPQMTVRGFFASPRSCDGRSLRRHNLDAGRAT